MIATAAGVGLVSVLFGLPTLAIISGIVTLFLLWFFRNPHRVPPPGDELIISPADGKVVEIEPCRDDRFLHREIVRIGIFMGVFDVHVNCMAVAGKIGAIHYFPGKYLMAFHPKASLENEHQAMVVESDHGFQYVMVQIAGLLARRIETWVKVGEHLTRGERFGLIRLGSKVDLFLPLSVSVRVQVGDRVKAGETVVGVIA